MLPKVGNIRADPSPSITDQPMISTQSSGSG